MKWLISSAVVLNRLVYPACNPNSSASIAIHRVDRTSEHILLAEFISARPTPLRSPPAFRPRRRDAPPHRTPRPAACRLRLPADEARRVAHLSFGNRLWGSHLPEALSTPAYAASSCCQGPCRAYARRAGCRQPATACCQQPVSASRARRLSRY